MCCFIGWNIFTVTYIASANRHCNSLIWMLHLLWEVHISFNSRHVRIYNNLAKLRLTFVRCSPAVKCTLTLQALVAARVSIVTVRAAAFVVMALRVLYELVARAAGGDVFYETSGTDVFDCNIYIQFFFLYQSMCVQLLTFEFVKLGSAALLKQQSKSSCRSQKYGGCTKPEIKKYINIKLSPIPTKKLTVNHPPASYA